MTMLEYHGRPITTLHVEPTSFCNLACPQCPRTIRDDYTEQSLTVEQFASIVTPSMLRALQYLYFCGNLGDPVVTKDLVPIIQYIRQHAPELMLGIHTNGAIRQKEWWASLPVYLGEHHHVIFSIDGLEDTNHLYRVGSNWARLMENVTNFIEHGGKAQWHYLAFQHNQHQIEAARELSKVMGFEDFVVKSTLRPIRGPLKLSELPQVVTIIKELVGSTVNCQALRERSMFLSSEGKLYPCCYTGYKDSIRYTVGTDTVVLNLKQINRLPHRPRAPVCIEVCSSVDGKNLTERQFLDR